MSDESTRQKWPASLASAIAARLITMLRPLCEPECCTFAGSLRRGREEVGDLEILYVPKIGPIRRPGEMFESQGSLADHYLDQRLFDQLHKRLNKNGHATWGQRNKYAVHRATGLPIDFFATSWDCWFVALVIRTGPKESNLRLIEGARRQGLQLHAYGAFTDLKTGTERCPTSEREVFELCGLPYLEPAQR